MKQGIWTGQWVRKETKPPLTFDPCKERDAYKKSRKDLLETEWGASTSQPMYDMPPAYDHSITKRKFGKVSNLKSFLNTFLELMKDETSLNSLCRIIDQCAQDKEAHFSQ
jgi:hypothetical protein